MVPTETLILSFAPQLPGSVKNDLFEVHNSRVVDFSDFKKVREFVRVTNPEIFLLQMDEVPEDTWCLLQDLSRKSPSTVIIGWALQPRNEILKRAVNDVQIQRMMIGPLSPETLRQTVQSAIDLQRVLVQQQAILREINVQNRQLEALTSGLEKLVSERTVSAEKSKIEVEEKLKHIKDLVQFIKDLSFAQAMDEVLSYLRRELKFFHGVRQPVLAYSSPDGQQMITFYQGKQITEKSVSTPWPRLHETRRNDVGDSRYLANELGRPVAKIISIPLQTDGRTVLYVEHSMNVDEIEEFQIFIQERSQTLSLAVDRIALESHLRFSSFQWASTFDGIQDPIAIVDLDHKLIRANRHFAKHAYTNVCHKAFAESDQPCRNCPMPKVLASGQSLHQRVRIQGRLYEVHSYPIRIGHMQSTTTVINHYVDITDAQELYGRLVQSEKLAAIGLLAGNIAHELNNPLTGIRSLAQILLTEIEAPSPVHSDLQEVERAAGRSQKIIENLLQFSKGKGAQQKQAVALNNLVLNTLPLLKTSLSEHRHDIILSPEDTTVEVEPQLLQQVIFNLVANACQAMTQAGQIEIKTQITRDLERSWVEFIVQDSGPGIPPEIQAQVFEPFFTTKAEGHGTGLGLSVCLSIVKEFNGSIDLQSQTGHGARFTVRLPRYKDRS